MNRYMKYREAKGVRVELTNTKKEEEILVDNYEYVRIENLSDCYKKIAVLINNAQEEDYIIVDEVLELAEINIKKLRFKVLDNGAVLDKYNVQAILMR